jgi:hypothetical protein
MTEDLKSEIQNLLNNVQNSQLKHVYIQDIIGYIEAMLKCFEGEKLIEQNQLRRLALGLGRLISDDYEHYESEIGIMVNPTINHILSVNDTNA